jgi:hypothetical protein
MFVVDSRANVADGAFPDVILNLPRDFFAPATTTWVRVSSSRTQEHSCHLLENLAFLNDIQLV